MELSRFDAAGEEVRLQPVDLGRLIRDVATARLPDAVLEMPDDRAVDRDRTRAGSSGSSATSSTTLASMRPARSSSSDSPATRTRSGSPSPIAARASRRTGSAGSSNGSSRPIRAARGGSGLGLAIAAEHAALLGGRIRAKNREGGGLEIELRLPVTRPLPHGDPAANGADRR